MFNANWCLLGYNIRLKTKCSYLRAFMQRYVVFFYYFFFAIIYLNILWIRNYFFFSYHFFKRLLNVIYVYGIYYTVQFMSKNCINLYRIPYKYNTRRCNILVDTLRGCVQGWPDQYTYRYMAIVGDFVITQKLDSCILVYDILGIMLLFRRMQISNCAFTGYS